MYREDKKWSKKKRILFHFTTKKNKFYGILTNCILIDRKTFKRVKRWWNVKRQKEKRFLNIPCPTVSAKAFRPGSHSHCFVCKRSKSPRCESSCLLHNTSISTVWAWLRPEFDDWNAFDAAFAALSKQNLIPIFPVAFFFSFNKHSEKQQRNLNKKLR